MWLGISPFCYCFLRNAISADGCHWCRYFVVVFFFASSSFCLDFSFYFFIVLSLVEFACSPFAAVSFIFLLMLFHEMFIAHASRARPRHVCRKYTPFTDFILNVILFHFVSLIIIQKKNVCRCVLCLVRHDFHEFVGTNDRDTIKEAKTGKREKKRDENLGKMRRRLQQQRQQQAALNQNMLWWRFCKKKIRFFFLFQLYFQTQPTENTHALTYEHRTNRRMAVSSIDTTFECVNRKIWMTHLNSKAPKLRNCHSTRLSIVIYYALP